MQTLRTNIAGIFLPLLLSITIAFISPTMIRASETGGTQDQSQQTVYTCPMHPEVTSDKPGNCPKCGMKLVKKANEAKTEISAVEKIKKAKTLLEEAKDELGKDGKYNCCIDHECNTCALEHQSCSCYKSLKAGKPVCNECYAGWQRGEGVDKKIKKSQVKTSYSKHAH